MSDGAARAGLWQVLPDRPVGRAVVLPGAGYTVDHPLLWWTCQVLAEGGWRVATVRWVVDDAARADPAGFVERAALRALDVAGSADRTLLVGKSFGTWAAPLAARNGWPAVWLTPLLTSPGVADAVRHTHAPGLLVGGTADEVWDGDLARGTGLEVLEVPAADHVLGIPGSWRRSFQELGRVLEAVERFAAGLV